MWLWVGVVLSVDFKWLLPNDSLSPAAVLANHLYDIHLCLISSPVVVKPSRSLYPCWISGGFLLVVVLSVLQLWEKKKHLK